MPCSGVERAKRALVAALGRRVARQGLRSERRQGSSWVESEQMLRARMGSSVGERACAGAREKSAGQAQARASVPPPRTPHPGSMPSLVAQAKGLLCGRRQGSSWVKSEQMWRGREGLVSGRRQGSSWVASESAGRSTMRAPPGPSFLGPADHELEVRGATSWVGSELGSLLSWK